MAARSNPRSAKERRNRTGNTGQSILTLILVFALAHPAGYPRQEKQQSPTSSVATAQVIGNDCRTIFVSVLDKQGNPIANLKREDFSVREEGALQEVIDVSSTEAAPLVVGILIDASGSTVLGNHREEKLQAISKFLPTLIGKSDEAFIAAFNDDFYIITRNSNDVTVLQKGMKTVIEEMTPRGSTALYGSLVTATSLMQIKGKRKIILVLSDFQDNVSENSFNNAISLLQKTGTALFVLQDMLYSRRNFKKQQEGQKLGQQAALQTGGASYKVDSDEAMANSLKQVQLILRNSYAVKYRDKTHSKEGKNVVLRITVKGSSDADILAPRKLSSAIPAP